MGLFKTHSEKEVKRVRPIVEKINSLEPAMKELSDSELVAKTPYFKEQLKNGKTLDDILPEAFAVVREASRRVLGMRHFDVQLIGGIILHQGRIAEMKTGEGKTLVATLPVYLNALTGEGVHVITVKPGFMDTKMTEGLPLNPALTASPKKAAEGIYKAFKNKKNVAYVLPIWAIVMLIIRNIPEFIFKKLKL